MSTTVIKVILETNHLVFRDIAIDPNKSLEELHFAILSAFDFEGKQMASFVKTDDNWQAEAEYSLASLSDDDEELLMKNNKIASVLAEKGEVLSFIYDYLNEWRFELEVLEIKKETPTETTVLKKHGKAPDESERHLSGDDASKILMNEILGEDLEEEEGDEDLFDSGNFDSIDDYDEFL